MIAGFQDVWKGTGQEALVSGLVPGHQYGVRICASNSAGQGPFSEVLRVGTAPAPPGAPTWTRKQPAPSAHSLTVQWGESSNNIIAYSRAHVRSAYRSCCENPVQYIYYYLPNRIYLLTIVTLYRTVM